MLKDFKTWVIALGLLITAVFAFTAKADDSLQSQYATGGEVHLPEHLTTYVAPDNLYLGDGYRSVLERTVQDAYLDPN